MQISTVAQNMKETHMRGHYSTGMAKITRVSFERA